MLLIDAIKKTVTESIWIPAGLLGCGVLLLWISQNSTFLEIIRRLFSESSSNFVVNTAVTVGLPLVIISFVAFFFWITASEKKRLAGRKTAWQIAAQIMQWDYSESYSRKLSTYLENFKQCRVLDIKNQPDILREDVSNILSRTIDGVLYGVFDYQMHGSYRNDDGISIAHFETVYLVTDKQMDLPYFQTQPNFLGNNAVTDYFRKKDGINDINFSQRPHFSNRYILEGERQKIKQVFTPPVFDFYEQNQLYRTIGDGAMLCLIQIQKEPINQFTINEQLQILHDLYRLLKI